MKRFDMRVSLTVCFAAMIWGAVAHMRSPPTLTTAGALHSLRRSQTPYRLTALRSASGF